ncbi:MAG TPA: sulfur oxidation c-type cytochrome SoxX [Gammaproteobacteria bacterium]|nr:sulfur oxidation c-type cytochrome SoxX [Gammaproteobacteria bacterium]
MSATNLASNAIAEGKKIAFDPNKGNCLACHAIKGGKLPGNIGPPLVKMKQRYPNKAYLREQIGNPINNNPNSIMPLYEKYKILSESELNKVVEFIYSL